MAHGGWTVTQKRESIGWLSFMPLRRRCPQDGMFRLDALPHTAELGELHEVRHGVAQPRRQQRRVDGGLPRLPAAQQRLESFVPEDGVQLEAVLGDVGAVIAARVGAHRRPQPGLVERRRKRRRVVVQLRRHLAVEQNLAVLQTPSHDIRPPMTAAASATDV